MATSTQNASTMMDAIADWRGMASLDGPRKIDIAEKVSGNTTGTNDEKADAFLQVIFDVVVHVLRKNAESGQRQANESNATQAGDDEVADL